MEEHFVWMTTRRIKPGTLTEFEKAWRPGPHPEGMLTAYAYWSDDEQEKHLPVLRLKDHAGYRFPYFLTVLSRLNWFAGLYHARAN